MVSLSGKVAIVTGAADGQGAAEARLLHQRGAKVALTDISSHGQAVADEMGDGAIFIQHNVSGEAGWDHVVDRTLEKFGRVDILAKNAGIYRLASFRDIDRALWGYDLSGECVGTIFWGARGMRANDCRGAPGINRDCLVYDGLSRGSGNIRVSFDQVDATRNERGSRP